MDGRSLCESGRNRCEEEEKQEQGMEGVGAEETKKGRMRCGRKDEKEEKEKGERRERRIENGEGDARNAPSSPGAFPSTELGNNMTPINGRLGKNTTPTSINPTELNQNLQVDPQQRQPDFGYTPKEAEYSK